MAYNDALTHDNQVTGSERLINLSNVERWISGIGGGALMIYGLTKRGLPGTALALFGASLVYRGASGNSRIYEALKINRRGGKTKNAAVRHGEGIKVEKSITVNKPPEELYRFWRHLENLPRFMSHLESVRVLDDKRSHWAAKAPLGQKVEWDAEIINDKENELIAWRSIEASQVSNAGSVRFERAPNGRGTIVRVSINYEPPGGRIGALVAKLFGEEPELQVEEDLRRFKQLMETGEVASTEGQPTGEDVKSETRATGR